jgi:hypothetical protein
MNFFKWHGDITERVRLWLGWSNYAMCWVAFIKGVVLTCMVMWLLG